MKPIPAPRQFRSVSSSELTGNEVRGSGGHSTKSASSIKAREYSRPVSDVPVVSGQANNRKTSLPPMSLVTLVTQVSQQQPTVTPVTSATPVTTMTPVTNVTSVTT